MKEDPVSVPDPPLAEFDVDGDHMAHPDQWDRIVAAADHYGEAGAPADLVDEDGAYVAELDSIPTEG